MNLMLRNGGLPTLLSDWFNTDLVDVDFPNMMSVDTDPYGYHGPYWRRTNVNLYQHKEGTLLIDVMDSESKNLLWRRWAVSAFDSKRPEKTADNVKQAASLIFEKYPFKAPQQKIDRKIY